MLRFLTILSITVILTACRTNVSHHTPINSATNSLWDVYDNYKEKSITNRFAKHRDLVPLIEKHATSGLFTNEVLGTSTEGRTIHHLSMGDGKIKVLLWSQMHGDESTATMALFDVFNFFAANDEFDSLRSSLLSKLELHFVPMLNPDGAEVWKRRNALGIDINRDARLLATPEGRALTDIAKKLQPQFGFNLHDQSVYYTAGDTREPATISFLAPAYNYEKEMNEVRTSATQLILVMNRAIQQKIPGKVAKYDDEHDPRCFGDTFQGRGISTILIESGGYPGDVEKQHIRKVNFYALLTAFESIANGSFTGEELASYDAIPQNSRFLYDLVIRNVSVEKNGQTFVTHLGINRAQLRNDGFQTVNFRGSIEEMGDMDRQFGNEELNAASLRYQSSKVKTIRKAEWEKLTRDDEFALAKQGFLFMKWSDGVSPKGPVAGRLLNLTNTTDVPDAPSPGVSANFLLVNNQGSPVHAVVNGFLVDLAGNDHEVPNAMGY